MHSLTTTSALAIACAISGCAPTSKTTESEAPPAPSSAAAQATSASPPEAESAPAPQPMGKRAAPQPGELVSPVIAARGGGKGWEIRISNTGGYDHRVVLTWGNSGKRGEGMAAFQPSADDSNARIVLRGTLDAEDGGKAMTVELLKQACPGDDGTAHEHSIHVTVSGMPPLHGCGDLAI